MDVGGAVLFFLTLILTTAATYNEKDDGGGPMGRRAVTARKGKGIVRLAGTRFLTGMCGFRGGPRR